MASYKCPGCGMAYNGKRCQNCFYEPFTEEIAHGGHTHEGEPLVVEIPERNTARPKTKPRGKRCEPYPGKRKKQQKLPKWAIAMLTVLFLVITNTDVLDLVMEDMMNEPRLELPNIAADLANPEPMPDISGFLDGTVLYDANDILVLAQWQEGDAFGGSIPVYVQNDSIQDLSVTTDWVYLNSFLGEYSYLYCQADAGESAVGYLWLDEEDLLRGGISTLTEITFRLDIYDADSYEDFDECQPITLHSSVPEDFVQPVDDSGQLLYDQEGLRVIYKGYTQEDCDSGELLFFVENIGDETIQVYSEVAYVNGEEAPVYLWIELLPGTRGITHSALYQLAEMGVESVSGINTMEISLGIVPNQNWDRWIQTDLLAVDVAG